MAAQPQAAGPILVRTTGEMEVKHEEGMHFFKALFIGLAVLILAMVGANYFLVEKPLTTNLAQTRFASVPVYAHLGAFVQPNVVVIHLPDASAVRPDRLTRFLVDLAQSTPQNPLSHDLFGRVALTNGWTAQYSFSGYSWNQLGGMAKDSEDQRKEFIMDSLGDGAGQSLMPETTMSDKAQKAKRDKVWQTFVDHFSAQ